MTDKELSKLRRVELLEMLIAQGKDYAKLQEELKETQKALHSREITIQKAGSIAEAAYQLNDVVGSTQRAVDMYMDNVKRQMTQQQVQADAAVSEARKYATDTVSIAEKRTRLLLNAASDQAAQILFEARTEAEHIITQARETAAQIEADAQIRKMELLAEAQQEIEQAQENAAPEPPKKFLGIFKIHQ